MVEKFQLDLTIDPASALAAAKKVDAALDKTEREALDTRNALQAAMDQRNLGVIRALGKVNRTLLQTQEFAQLTDARISQMGKDINSRGLRDFNRRLDRTDDLATRLTRTLRRVFVGLSALRLIREVTELSDLFVNTRNRIRLVTDSAAELADVQSKLFDISNDTRSSFEGTSTIFTRLAFSQDSLGVSTQKLLLFTKSLNQAIVLSGPSAKEARNAVIQLSQGLAAGALRGDELRSVLEQLPFVADLIAKRMGVTRGELRKLGAQGLITSEIIISALTGAAGQLEEQFATTVKTISQGVQVLENNTIELIGSFNEATGASQVIASGLVLLGDNLHATVTAVGVLSSALLINYAGNAVKAAIVGTKALRVAQLATAASFVVAGEAVFFLSRRLQGNADALKDIQAASLAADTSQTLTSFGLLGLQVQRTQQELEQLNETFEKGGRTNQVAAARIKQLRAALVDLEARQREAVETAKDEVDTRARSNSVTQQVIEGLKEEGRLLTLTTAERRIQEAIAKTEVQLRKGHVDITQDSLAVLRAEIEALIRGNAARARQNELVEKIRSPAERYKALLLEFEELQQRGVISLDELNRARERFAQLELKETKKTQDPFEAQLASLKLLNAQLDIRASKQGIEQEALLIELQLREKSRELTIEEQRVLAGLLIQKKELNGLLKEQSENEKAAAKALADKAKQEAQERSRIESLRAQVDVQGTLIAQQEELNALRTTEFKDILPQVDRAVEDLRLRQLEASNTLGDGFSRALLNIKREAEDLAAVGESVVNVFADRATEAIIDFARTGEFNFREFASSILEELTRIIVRLLVVKALNTVFGGLASGGADSATSATGAGLQFGGVVQPGQAPRPIGENGPELFVPNQTGTVIPNPRDQKQPEPKVNLTSVVLVDMEQLVPEIIAGGAADEAIVQRIGVNQDRVNQVQN